MRTGSAFWPLPAPIRSCTPISVAAAPWTSSSGKRGCSVGFKRKPFCKAISADELVHRALKDFASQTLPFKRFAPNAAYYYTLLVAFFLYECFKEDVCQRGAAELLSHDLTPADRRCSGEDRPPCRADPLESNGGHLEAASDRPTLAKERPPAAFRLGLNLKKPKPRCCLMAPVCPLAPRLRVFSSFRERNYPRAPF